MYTMSINVIHGSMCNVNNWSYHGTLWVYMEKLECIRQLNQQ